MNLLEFNSENNWTQLLFNYLPHFIAHLVYCPDIEIDWFGDGAFIKTFLRCERVCWLVLGGCGDCVSVDFKPHIILLLYVLPMFPR